MTANGTTRPRFGIAIPPSVPVELNVELARAADEGGLELFGVPDHPYSPKESDALSVIPWLLAHTSRIHLFTDVAHLPLRPPATLAKAAATLDLLSGGRFELGLGAGGDYAPSAAMGGLDRRPGEALEALADAIAVIRAYWTEPSATYRGAHYSIDDIQPGPRPQRPIPIWVGSIRPRMLGLTGRLTDGWAAPLPVYLPRDRWPDAQARIDAGAREAGRDPRAVRRMAQLPGVVADAPVDGPAPGHSPAFHGSVEQWIDNLVELGERERFDTFVLWPRPPSVEQVERFAREVAPAVRERLAVPIP
jgi:alkanesulfonate monooxygenase SsuD/methylene tetrahydromethanopterin reductase-like flavin-dependent oxidoreductase (luciferase family)